MTEDEKREIDCMSYEQPLNRVGEFNSKGGKKW